MANEKGKREPTYSNWSISSSGNYNPSAGGTMTDDWFWDAIEQYKGTKWYDVLASNPYLLANNPYAASDWDNFMLDVFGSNEPWRKHAQSLRTQSNEWLSMMLQQMRQEGYDSAEAQMQREKLAGVNPDISGGQGITPGAAAENDQPISPNTFGTGPTSPEQLGSIAKAGINFVSQVFSMSQGVYGMIGQGLSLVASDLSNHQSAMDLLYNEVLNTLPASDLSEEGIKNLDSAVLLRSVEQVAKDSSFNKRTRRVLSRYADSLQGDAATAKVQDFRMALARKYLEQKKGVAQTMGDPYYSQDLSQWIDNVAPLLTAFTDSLFQEYEANYAEDVNREAYANSSDPVTEAQADAEDARKRKAEASNLATSEEAYKDIYDFLKNDDSVWSKLGLLLLPELRQLIRSFSGGTRKMSFSRRNVTNNNSTTSYVTKTGPTVINN